MAKRLTNYTSLLKQRTALVNYLAAKVQAEDWHGVSDAANDLRVIDAQIEYEERSESEVERL